MNRTQLSAAMRELARALQHVADALDAEEGSDVIPVSDEERRNAALIRAWGDHGLTAEQAADLMRRHGFDGRKVSAWVRGGWAEMRDDLRYLTSRSHQWLAERPEPGPEERG